jgi:hypothetical protein
MSVDLDRQLQEYCRLMDEAQVSLSFDDILERSGELPVISGRTSPQLSPRRRWIAVAAAALAVLLLAIGIRLLPGVDGTPQPADDPPLPTTVPDNGLMPWSPESQFLDWPGPIREEATITTEALIVGHGGDGIYDDPVGDVGVDVVDVIEVTTQVGIWGLPSLDRDVFFRVAGNMNSIPDPREEWIAYGIVVDYTGEGRPDARYGIDNAVGMMVPSITLDDGRRVVVRDTTIEEADPGFLQRMWRTDLATGVNQVRACCEDPMLMDAVFPFPVGWLDEAGRGSMFVVPEANEIVFHFYVWASVIRDGRVVAVDYAPDAGWFAIGRP